MGFSTVFCHFPNGAPRMQGQIRPDMGLFLEDRLVAFVIAGDTHCGWSGFFPVAEREASPSFPRGPSAPENRGKAQAYVYPAEKRIPRWAYAICRYLFVI